MKRRASAARPVSAERIAMVEVAAVEVAAAIEIVVIEVVAIDDRSAVRDVGVVVVDHSVAVPVASPVMPAPSKSSEESDAEADSKSDPDAIEKDSRHRVPTWIRNDRRSIDEPRIVSRYIDDIRIGWLDAYRVVLNSDVFLLIAV